MKGKLRLFPLGICLCYQKDDRPFQPISAWCDGVAEALPHCFLRPDQGAFVINDEHVLRFEERLKGARLCSFLSLRWSHRLLQTHQAGPSPFAACLFALRVILCRFCA